MVMEYSFMFFFLTQIPNSTEEKKKTVNLTALGIHTNEVDPEGFLNEISTLNNSGITKDEIDEDFIVTEAPTKEEIEDKSYDFFKVLCIWC